MSDLPKVTRVVGQQWGSAGEPRTNASALVSPGCPRRHQAHSPHLCKNEGCVVLHVDQAILDGLHRAGPTAEDAYGSEGATGVRDPRRLSGTPRSWAHPSKPTQCPLPGFSPHQSRFSGGSDSKESVCNVGDLGSIPGSGRYPEEGNGNPLQYSRLENPMDRGARQATVHGVTKSRTRLTNFTSQSSSGRTNKRESSPVLLQSLVGVRGAGTTVGTSLPC